MSEQVSFGRSPPRRPAGRGASDPPPRSHATLSDSIFFVRARDRLAEREEITDDADTLLLATLAVDICELLRVRRFRCDDEDEADEEVDNAANIITESRVKPRMLQSLHILLLQICVHQYLL